jgi:hypothetical protein
MYQTAPKVEHMQIALDIAEWSITRYGYFMRKDADKIETVKEFAKELERVPSRCLSFVQKAKDHWFDEGGKMAPNMQEFINLLRTFYNKENNDSLHPVLTYTRFDYARDWDQSSHADKMNFFDRHSEVECPGATKYFVRQYYREQDMDEDEILKIVGRN